MARMHARKKGRSGSTRPNLIKAPEWQPMSKDEITKIIIELTKNGESSSSIGIILRDQYAVPNVKLFLGKSITQVVEKAGLKKDLPEDLANLMKRAIKVHRHLEDNSRDKHNRRGLYLIEAKIRRLERYYKKKGVLPDNWNYSYQNAKLLVE